MSFGNARSGSVDRPLTPRSTRSFLPALLAGESARPGVSTPTTLSVSSSEA